MNITIYHNPTCGTSRNALAAIRAAGHEPRIVEYLKTPLTRPELQDLISRMGIAVRDVVRKKEALFRDLGLDERDVGEDELLDAMIEHPILINRPIVVTESHVRLCRPSEKVKELL
jgi:arsenate reductase